MIRTIFLAVILFSKILNTQSQTILNSSFEQWGVNGICEVNTPPNGWSSYSNAGQDFEEGNTLLCPSSIPNGIADGNVYGRAYSEDEFSGEGIFQNVSGFIVGNTYSLSFQYAGSNLYPGQNDVSWHIYLDDIEVGQSPFFSSLEDQWNLFEFEFIATSPILKIGFRLFTLNNNGSGSGGIDNIQVQEVVQTDPPIAQFSQNQNVICAGECINFINNSLLADAIEWEFEGGDPSVSSNSQNVTVCYNTPGTYDVQLTASNAFGSDTEAVMDAVTVIATPSAEINLINDSLILSSLINVDEISWSFNTTPLNNDNLEFIFPVENGNYNVVLTNSSLCETVLTMPIVFNEIDTLTNLELLIWAPNAVTFDSNGINDYWLLEGNKEDWAEYHIQIFNRWGQIIFESSDPYQAWTGNSFNSFYYSQDGIYNFRAILRLTNQIEYHQISGHITVLR